MAKRLTTRVSAGASLVLGLGVAGIGFATPAQAVTVTQQYECTYNVLNVGEVAGESAVTVELTADIPATAQVGDTLTSDVTAKVTIPDSRRDSLYGLLAVRAIDGPDAATAAADPNNKQDARNQAGFTVSGGSSPIDGVIPLSAPLTVVPSSGELVVTATGAIAPVTLEQAGSYTVTAGDFQAYIRGYETAEGTGYKTNVTMNCTNVSADKTIATVEVTGGATPTTSDPTTSDPTTSDPTTSDPTTSEPTTSEPTTSEPTTSEPTTSEPTTSTPTSTSEPTTSAPTSTPAPETDDWFHEPSELPISQDKQSFTVEGTADHDGTVIVQLLDKDKKVIKSYTWDVTKGANSRSFDFVEGTDYARVISQDCVDADGKDESVVDSGCNVEYYAPWASITETKDDDSPSTSDDDSGSGPETPGKVETDSFQRVVQEQGSNAPALALGGLLLAGAAAGSVVVARRRTAAQH